MPGQVIPVLTIPREIARSARATFSRDNFYIQMGEQLESILRDIQAKRLVETGIVLSQITIFQYLEGLPDTHVIDAIRIRLDWKFALHMPSYSPVFHKTKLCTFRQIALTDTAFQGEIQRLMDRLLLFNHPQINKLRNIKSLEMVKMVCSINRLNLVCEAMIRAIDALVCRFPEWLRTIALPHWYGRYNRSMPSFDLSATLEQQEISIQEIITDIRYILEEARSSGSDAICELDELKNLQEIWTSQTMITNQLLDINREALSVNNCSLCIYRRRIEPSTNYF